MPGEEILIADGNPRDRDGLIALCERRGLVPTAVDSAHAARERVGARHFAVALVDLDLPGGGVDLLEYARTHARATQLVAVSSRRNYDGAVAAFRAGCLDVVLKRPEELARLDPALDQALLRYHADAGRSPGDEAADVLDELVKTVVALGRQVYAAEIETLTQAGGPSPGVLFVDDDPAQLAALRAGLADVPMDAQVELSGGGALDRIGASRLDVVVAKADLLDLPGSIVVSAAQQRNAECAALLYTGVGTGAGRVERVSEGRVVDALAPVRDAGELAEHVRRLLEEQAARWHERRVLQVIGGKHGELLRRYGEIKRRLGGGGR